MPGDQSVSQAFISSSKPQRRQNTSCDRCRRSKRRCFVPSIDVNGVPGTICTNCQRLKHHCTFEFAKRHPTSPISRKQKTQVAETTERIERDDSNIFDGLIEGLPGGPEIQFDATSVAGQDILASWLNLDLEQAPDDHTTSLSNSKLVCPPFVPAWSDTSATPYIELNNQRSLSFNRMRMTQNAPNVPLSFNSPIYLLNSGIDAKILGDRLTRIYDAISTASSCRFLEYDCNLYATAGNRYRIGEGHYGSSTASPPAQSINTPEDKPSNNLLQEPVPSNPENEDIVHEISLLGSIRFLDHFSHLYGNRLDSNARRKSDAVLKAVLLAFSMQWLPVSDRDNSTEPESTLNAFTDAWVRARALLEDVRHVKSFRIILATLTFVGIVTPTKLREMEGFVPPNFLDSALQKLCDLDGLLTQYRKNLGSSSTYSSLLEASLNIIRWTAYIRDTGAALSMDRQCKLPDLWGLEKVASNKESMTAWTTCQSILEFDSHVQAICLKASAETFCVWRQIIKINTSAMNSTNSVPEHQHAIVEAINSSIAAINQLNASFQPFLAHSIRIFLYLSTCPRISIGERVLSEYPFANLCLLFKVSLVMFWSLGIFHLDDVFKNACQYINDSDEQRFVPIIQTYQQEAASFVAQTVECVLTLPMEEAFNLQNGLGAEVPITAYHVTPSLAVTALQKAIEGVIQQQIHLSQDADLFEQGCGMLIPDGTWDRQLDVLMKGLMSLDVTIGGSQTSSMALQLLMRQHGDILSECWTSSFET
ncbi:uncharacterized protein N7511_007629 [Penicillium nucicola]|uniref:uncharacterized protein n=1 Tax=Penicillium nucicola TaxID=1850975 RepID=UPI0025453C80|nr:uncharacterized protein N7511_007629 [Penicillium nucicola]KAJ5753476.1 hypothetical protein N7511_007629 [Penicillium nucicola]